MDAWDPTGEKARAVKRRFGAEAFEQEGGVCHGQVLPAVIAARIGVKRIVAVGELLGHPCRIRTGVLIREHHGRGQPGQLTRVDGERFHVERRAVCGGIVELSDAVACWWVLDDDHRARRREAGTWTSSGHIVAAHGDELYDQLAQTRGGYGRLQDFGVRFGYKRVVIHLQPHVEPDRLQANTARTMLLLDHEPLPWTRWGEEFAAAMPEEIRRLQEHAASTDATPRQDAIRSRVASILPLYRLSRYRPTKPPRPSPATGDRDDSPTRTHRAKRAAPTVPSTKDADSIITDNAATANIAAGAPPADDSDHGDGADAVVDLPDVAWITARDGTRAPGDLEDQAARYHPARHELTINADFRAINDLTAHWHHRYTGIPGAHAVIEAQVREWCEQVLVEVVLAARNSTWSQDQLDALLSPIAFTAALLPRHLLHAMLQKRLAQKLGPPRTEPATPTRITTPTNRNRQPRPTRRPEGMLDEAIRL